MSCKCIRICNFILCCSWAVAGYLPGRCIFFVNLRQFWNDVLVANEGVLQEFKFWLAHVDAFNGYPINRPLSSSAVLTCDASKTDYTVHVVFFTTNGSFVPGMWNELQRCMSFSYRELRENVPEDRVE